MSASDYVPIFFKNRLRLAGRPPMSTRPRQQIANNAADFNWAACAPTSAHATREEVV